MIPRILLLLMWFIAILINANKHGQPKDQEYNIWSALLACAIEIAILWWGGFWNV